MTETVHVGAIQLGVGLGPVLIAGPCAVESTLQIMTTALAVRAAGGSILRGGAYKPRTDPRSFQWYGIPALDMLRQAAAASGLSSVSEVTSPGLVEAVAERVDMLQIGTRNAQNYDLLREVGRQRKPVLLKRGMGSTVRDQMGHQSRRMRLPMSW